MLTAASLTSKLACSTTSHSPEGVVTQQIAAAESTSNGQVTPSLGARRMRKTRLAECWDQGMKNNAGWKTICRLKFLRKVNGYKKESIR